MTLFEVWAPLAKQVRLKLDERLLLMQAEEDGWWSLDEASAEHGSLYQYVLDGGYPLPDPRSPSQPQGVHGPSQVVDHSHFEWRDATFRPPPLGASILYELHIGTFTPPGTFDSAIDRLGHLLDLGIQYIELMPVNHFPGQRGWGYDGVSLWAPHAAYGGPDGLKRLVDACHARGLGVILDVVYNHLGPDGNYLPQFGNYFTDRHHTPWGQALNFDGPDSDEVRRFVIDNALMWLRDYHMDALRLDAADLIMDNSAVHILEQMAEEVQMLENQTRRQRYLIAESDLNAPRMIRPPDIGGYGLDAHWCDDFHHALHTVLSGESTGYYRDFGEIAQLAKSLTNAYVYDGEYSSFRQRTHGRPPTDVPAYRFVCFLQNHDQIGNRARGDRISHITRMDRAKIGAALVLTAPFIPMLFMGEEWAASTPFLYFTDHTDQELGQAITQGRRKDFAYFGWEPDEVPDPQSLETFERSMLNWDEVNHKPHAGVLKWYQDLIALRARLPYLSDGSFEFINVDFDEDESWLVMTRGPVLVAVNFDEVDHELSLNLASDAQVLLSSVPGVSVDGDSLYLPSESVGILLTG